VANQRKDYIHKLTRKLVNENQVIGIEDLNVSGMSKNGKLGLALLDSGLGMFKRFLEYKASESAHTVIVKMNRWEPSTQTCNTCGERVSKKLTLAIREWECEFCGALHDRDINAGLNIKRVASFMSTKYSYPGGSIVLAPPLLHLVNILPRTAVCAQ
jgi:putative transposase